MIDEHQECLCITSPTDRAPQPVSGMLMREDAEAEAAITGGAVIIMLFAGANGFWQVLGRFLARFWTLHSGVYPWAPHRP